VCSHQLAAIIDQRAAGISRIDRRIRLDEILVVSDSEVAASLALTMPIVPSATPNGSPMASA